MGRTKNYPLHVRQTRLLKFVMVCVAVLTLTSISYGQSNSLAQVSPKSPNIAGLDKFIETPVGLATGRVDLSIPLYDFNVGNLNIPISLDYNNDGLKPGEIPSWVGLGWNLFTGGHISYAQHGVNDFDPVRGLFAQGQSLLNSYFSSQMNPSQKEIYFNDIISKDVDSEYDEFYYSISSGSGSFHFLTATESRTNPKSDLLISKTSAGFRMTDDKGNTYFFESQEAISSQNTLEISPYFSDNSAYYITKIVAANGETAEFTYKQYFLQYITQTGYLMHSGNVSANCPSSSGNVNLDETLYHIYYLLPESIKFPLGSIKFNHSTAFREDLPLLVGSVGDIPYLSSIDIYDLNNIKMKGYDFNISYFGSNSRLRLDGIDEVSAGISNCSN